MVTPILANDLSPIVMDKKVTPTLPPDVTPTLLGIHLVSSLSSDQWLSDEYNSLASW